MKKILTVALAVAFGAGMASAQKGNIGFIYPCGAQQGTTVEVTVGGQGLAKAKGITISGKGVSGELIPAPQGQQQKKHKTKNIGEEDNLQLADQVRFRVTVAKDAELGMRDVRLIMPNGVTNRLFFEIGNLPDVLEDGAAELSATSASLPVTFNGQVMRSDVDRFRFHASKGQQLVLQVKGRVFVPYLADAVPGWFQPIIRLFDPSGKEVAYNDDYTYHVDPVIFYKVPKTGDYEVEINDALYRGREDFVYRIDIGELPFITSISPIGGPVGQKTQVKLNGYNLKTTTLTIEPAEAGRIPVKVTNKKGLVSNMLFFEADGLEQLKTAKLSPNSSRENAWDINVGETVESVVAEPMQQFWFKFESAGGRNNNLDLNVLARRLGAPTDMRMTIYDAAGNVVADVDDLEDPDESLMTHFADPEYTGMMKAGTYYVRLIESQGHSGEEYAFRLSVNKAQPDFSLHIEPAVLAVSENGTGVFNLIITRKQNFRGPVDVEVGNLPRGFKVAGTRIEQAQKKTVISITAPKGAEHQTIRPKVVGTANAGNSTISREASPVESMMQAFYYTHLIPVDEFNVEVGEELPFRISVVQNWKGALKLNRNNPVSLKVHLDRNAGYNNPVTVMLKSDGQGIKAEAVVIPEGESDGVLEVVVKGKNKKDLNHNISIYGVVKGSSGKIAGKGRSAYVASVTAYAPVFQAIIPAVTGKD